VITFNTAPFVRIIQSTGHSNLMLKLL